MQVKTVFPMQVPDYVMFSDSLQTIAIQSSDTYYDIPIFATTACDYDRTYAVEVVDKGVMPLKDYIMNCSQTLVTIKAGELAFLVKNQGFYDNFEDTDSLGINLETGCTTRKNLGYIRDETKVQLGKDLPFDIQRFYRIC